MESYRLAELKYAIFSRTGREIKKLRCSKLFLSTVSKLLYRGIDISISIQLHITRTPLESSRLGELKYAISAGQDVILKNKSIRKCKKWHSTTGVHGHCIADWLRQVLTSLGESEQLWSTIFPQPWVPRSSNLAHPKTCVQFPNRTALETIRPSEVVETCLVTLQLA